MAMINCQQLKRAALCANNLQRHSHHCFCLPHDAHLCTEYRVLIDLLCVAMPSVRLQHFHSTIETNANLIMFHACLIMPHILPCSQPPMTLIDDTML